MALSTTGKEKKSSSCPYSKRPEIVAGEPLPAGLGVKVVASVVVSPWSSTTGVARFRVYPPVPAEGSFGEWLTRT